MILNINNNNSNRFSCKCHLQLLTAERTADNNEGTDDMEKLDKPIVYLFGCDLIDLPTRFFI